MPEQMTANGYLALTEDNLDHEMRRVRHMAAAMIEGALIDFLFKEESPLPSDRRAVVERAYGKLQAYGWLFLPPSSFGKRRLSYAWCCEVLSLNVGIQRAYIKASWPEDYAKVRREYWRNLSEHITVEEMVEALR